MGRSLVFRPTSGETRRVADMNDTELSILQEYGVLRQSGTDGNALLLERPSNDELANAIRDLYVLVFDKSTMDLAGEDAEIVNAMLTIYWIRTETDEDGDFIW